MGSCCHRSLPCWGPSLHSGDKKAGQLKEKEGRDPEQSRRVQQGSRDQQRAGAGGLGVVKGTALSCQV